ncbi:MAG: DNA gyrase inhibitor YacG [Candidatus Sulfotelmatobacter sp.]
MVGKRAVKLRCPICKNGVKSTDPEFPFCSERCRTIDLGKWASGAYVIPSPVTDADEQLGTADSGDSEDHDSQEHGKPGN